jgi:hypothetical protein
LAERSCISFGGGRCDGGGGGGDSASFFGEQVSQYKELAARLDAFSSSAAGFFSFQASNEEKTRVA